MRHFVVISIPSSNGDAARKAEHDITKRTVSIMNGVMLGCWRGRATLGSVPGHNAQPRPLTDSSSSLDGRSACALVLRQADWPTCQGALTAPAAWPLHPGAYRRSGSLRAVPSLLNLPEGDGGMGGHSTSQRGSGPILPCQRASTAPVARLAPTRHHQSSNRAALRLVALLPRAHIVAVASQPGDMPCVHQGRIAKMQWSACRTS